jgi:hypothetical protein
MLHGAGLVGNGHSSTTSSSANDAADCNSMAAAATNQTAMMVGYNRYFHIASSINWSRLFALE